MANSILRALEFLAVFDGDAMPPVSGRAAHGGRERAPQAGRSNINERGLAHFRQHEHRAPHTEWAKQWSVAGFVDACVDKWHAGEGTVRRRACRGRRWQGCRRCGGRCLQWQLPIKSWKVSTFCDGCSGAISFGLVKDVCSSCSSPRRVSFLSPRRLH